jgi:hypothetical protein
MSPVHVWLWAVSGHALPSLDAQLLQLLVSTEVWLPVAGDC